MLHFLNPIWLAASAGIIIPVLIHLWNIRKGKVLKIGSTLLIAESSQKSASSFRITQWLLLLLRCLLIILLSMLLASPQWREVLAPAKKGWIIIDQKDFSALYRRFKTPVDSLLKLGFELHQSEGAFKAVSLKEALPDSTSVIASNQLPANNIKHESNWTKIRRLDARLPAGFTVFLFTGNNINGIVESAQGHRPIVSLDLRWSMANLDTSTLSVPIASTYLANGKIRSRILKSGVDGSFFSDIIEDASATNIQRIPSADTSAIDITIYTEKYGEDARYLSAAIKAIAEFSQHTLRLTSVQNKSQIPSGQDWIFWLTEEDLPRNINAQNIFRYSAGKAIAVQSWLASDNGPLPENGIAVFQQTGNAGKRVAAAKGNAGAENNAGAKDNPVTPNVAATKDDAGGGSIEGNKIFADTNAMAEIIWKNGYGDPILTVSDRSEIKPASAENQSENGSQSTGKDPAANDQDKLTSKLYIFYSRFNPGWTDLPWSPAFPKLLLPLVLKDRNSTKAESLQHENDRRAVDVSDVMPTVVRDTYKTPQTAFTITSLDKLAWLFLFLLFAAERIIALNSSKFTKRKTSDA